METLKWRCEEQEKLIPTQPEGQREQLKQKLQQVTKTSETCNHEFMIPFKYYNCFQTTYFSDHLFMFKQSQFQIFEVEQRCGSLSVYWITERIKCILKEHLYTKMFHQQLNTSMESKLSPNEQNISAVNQNLCKHVLCPMSIFWKYTLPFYCGHIKEPGFSHD